jgi:hypothetical protein
LAFELVVEDLLEKILEAAIVGLEDRVLGREIDRIVAAIPMIELSRLNMPMATPELGA